MTDVTDLAAWLTQVWDEGEREAKRAPRGDGYATHSDCIDPDEMLARIAADRQILALHDWYEHEEFGVTCWTCMPGGQHYPCKTLRLLASVYADRPGYRDEWRVGAAQERQDL